MRCILKELFLVIACNSLSARLIFDDLSSRVRLGETSSKFILNTAIVGWNGTLEIIDNDTGRISGQSVSFTNGYIVSGTAGAFLTAKYDPTNGDKIILEGNGRLRAETGVVLPHIEVQGSSNFLEGQPTFLNSIVLAQMEPTATLVMDLQNTLSKDVILNRGKVVLTSDLQLGSGVKLVGEGTVDVNGVGLGLPFSVDDAWDTHLTFSHASINLRARTVLEDTWTFTHSEFDASGESHINGGGELFDLSSSNAILQVADYHTLYITDCHLKGLGDTTGTFSLMGPNSVVKMSNVTLSLADNYTFDHGQIYVDGSNCTFITGGYVITFTWSESHSTVDGIKIIDKGDPQKIIGTLTINGVKLYYDVLNQADANNIRPYESDNEYLKLENNGLIARSLGGSAGSIIITNNYYNATRNIDTGIGQELYFNKPTGEATWNITFDGNGYYLHFPSVYSGGSDKPITIDDGLSLTFKDVVLKDFDPSFIKSGADSHYYFDDGTVIELARNQDLTETWSFIGDSIIDGQCSALDLSASNAITVADGVTLALKNLCLTGLRDGGNLSDYGRLHCHENTSKLKLQKCELVFESDYTFTVGAIDVYEDVAFSGDGHTMIYNTQGVLSIKTDATLLFDRDFTFKYQADFDDSGGQTSATYLASRDRVQLVDESAQLHLRGCTLHSTQTGIMLETGTLIIDDKVRLKTDAVVDGEAPELKTSLDVKVLTGAILDVENYGRLKI